MAGSKRFLLTTIGSLGDLHPMLGLGLELRRRGHQVTIVSTAFYQSKVQALGLRFHSMRPNWNPTDSALISQCEELQTGPEILFRRLILPHLRSTYEDLLTAALEADCMIAGELCFAAPLVAEKLGLPWASAILSPTSFFSAHDPSLLVNAAVMYRLRNAGWLVNRAFLEFAKVAGRRWWNPVRDLRRDLGLNPDCDPLFRDKFSAHLVLALFDRSLALPQRDWPKQTVQPGFVFFDRRQTDDQLDSEADYETNPNIEAFIAAGPPPVVFTLGSTAVHNPGSFYESSIEAARQLGQRILLIGTTLPEGLAATDVLALSYAPYSEVFTKAAVVVHQGGSGTTGQALRAGRPQLIVPYGWDQPDNGARIARIGAGLTLERRIYTAASAAQALNRLLGDPHFAQCARSAAEEITGADAVKVACDAVEAIFR